MRIYIFLLLVIELIIKNTYQSYNVILYNIANLRYNSDQPIIKSDLICPHTFFVFQNNADKSNPTSC